jgi:hypothetical protein
MVLAMYGMAFQADQVATTCQLHGLRAYVQRAHTALPVYAYHPLF